MQVSDLPQLDPALLLLRLENHLLETTDDGPNPLAVPHRAALCTTFDVTPPSCFWNAIIVGGEPIFTLAAKPGARDVAPFADKDPRAYMARGGAEREKGLESQER